MIGYIKALNEIGVSYLGNVAQSMKMRLSYEHGTMTLENKRTQHLPQRSALP